MSDETRDRITSFVLIVLCVVGFSLQVQTSIKRDVDIESMKNQMRYNCHAVETGRSLYHIESTWRGHRATILSCDERVAEGAAKCLREAKDEPTQ